MICKEKRAEFQIHIMQIKSQCICLCSKALAVTTCREVDLQSVPSVFLRATQV